MRLTWTGAVRAILADIPAEIDEVVVIASGGTHIHLTGLSGSTVRRAGRTLSAADEKTLSADGEPIIVLAPQPGLRVEVA